MSENPTLQVEQRHRDAAANFRGLEMNDTWGIPSLEKAFARKGATHRVVDRAGINHRLARGWIGISWKSRDGQKREA